MLLRLGCRVGGTDRVVIEGHGRVLTVARRKPTAPYHAIPDVPNEPNERLELVVVLERNTAAALGPRGADVDAAAPG